MNVVTANNNADPADALAIVVETIHALTGKTVDTESSMNALGDLGIDSLGVYGHCGKRPIQ